MRNHRVSIYFQVSIFFFCWKRKKINKLPCFYGWNSKDTQFFCPSFFAQFFCPSFCIIFCLFESDSGAQETNGRNSTLKKKTVRFFFFWNERKGKKTQKNRQENHYYAANANRHFYRFFFAFLGVDWGEQAKEVTKKKVRPAWIFVEFFNSMANHSWNNL